jgi:hypothetical protein
MTYTVIFHAGFDGLNQYTAYAGRSTQAAGAHIDTVRNVLVLTRGSGTITYRENSKLTMICTVVDGAFTQENF